MARGLSTQQLNCVDEIQIEIRGERKTVVKGLYVWAEITKMAMGGLQTRKNKKYWQNEKT